MPFHYYNYLFGRAAPAHRYGMHTIRSIVASRSHGELYDDHNMIAALNCLLRCGASLVELTWQLHLGIEDENTSFSFDSTISRRPHFIRMTFKMFSKSTQNSVPTEFFLTCFLIICRTIALKPVGHPVNVYRSWDRASLIELLTR